MIYDVSIPIENGMPVWPSDPGVNLTPSAVPSRDRRHMIRLTSIEMGSHTGTHVDAPYHFVDGGRKLHEIPLKVLIGKVAVFHVAGVRSINRRHLEQLNWEGIKRVLFRTDNSDRLKENRFHKDFVYLEPDAGAFLVEHGLRLVGIDSLSIDRFDSEHHPTHLVLLPRNVVVLEGLDLSQVAPGRYHMVALPLNLQHADGAPTRVILMDAS
jgi:arylformamidase